MIRSRFIQERVVRNAFRILGLASLSSKVAVNGALGAAKRKAKLGVPLATPWDMPWLGDLPRSDAEIQYALSRLSNPSDRIVERFFWPAVARVALPTKSIGPLSSKTFRGAAGEVTAQVLGYEYMEAGVGQVTSENIAAVSFRLNLFGASEPPEEPFAFHDYLLYRIVGFVLNHPVFGDRKVGNSFPETAPDVAWAPAEALRTYLRYVLHILSCREYWDALLAADQESGFEPKSVADDVEKAKGQIVRLLTLEMIESNFFEHVLRSDDPFKSLFAELLLRPPDRPASPLKEEVLSQTLLFFDGRISRELSEIMERYLGRVKREPDQGVANKPVCNEAIHAFDQRVVPLLAAVPLKEEGTYGVRVKCADTLLGIASAFTWADDFDTSLALLNRAAQIAAGTHLAVRLQERIAETRLTIERTRVFSGLTPVSEMPYLDLHERFYGRSDPQPVSMPDGSVEESYVTTHYNCLFGIPLYPKKRYRVIRKEDGRYHVLGSLPLSYDNKVHITVVALAVVGLILYFAVAPGASTRRVEAPPPPPPYPSATSHPSVPAPPAYPSTSPTQASTPSQARPGGSGRVKRSEFVAMKKEVDSEKARLREMESELLSLEEEIKTLSDEIDRDEVYRKLLKEADQIREYNSRVSDHNAKVLRAKGLIAKYKNTYELYELKFKALNEKIKEYNARIANGR